MHKDFRGVEMVKGDLVAYVSGGRYINRITAEVISFTPKMVRIKDVKESRYEVSVQTVNPDCCWVLER